MSLPPRVLLARLRNPHLAAGHCGFPAHRPLCPRPVSGLLSPLSATASAGPGAWAETSSWRPSLTPGPSTGPFAHSSSVPTLGWAPRGAHLAPCRPLPPPAAPCRSRPRADLLSAPTAGPYQFPTLALLLLIWDVGWCPHGCIPSPVPSLPPPSRIPGTSATAHHCPTPFRVSQAGRLGCFLPPSTTALPHRVLPSPPTVSPHVPPPTPAGLEQWTRPPGSPLPSAV